MELSNLEIEKIKQRNLKVEKEKAWETSWTRRLTIAILTYLVIMVFLWILEVHNFYSNALVPVIGYLLSTISANIIKKYWLRSNYPDTDEKV